MNLASVKNAININIQKPEGERKNTLLNELQKYKYQLIMRPSSMESALKAFTSSEKSASQFDTLLRD